MTTETVAPNTLDGAATQHNAMPGLDQIAAKMTAMRQQAQRNRLEVTTGVETGTPEQAVTEEPVAPDAPEQSTGEPEVAAAPDPNAEPAVEETAQDEPVSQSDTTAQEVIDFIEFAESNPNAKFRFMRNGKEMIIDAKRAAAILGQGGAIHEEARQLKIERAEFDEYQRQAKDKTDGLMLAMEFTVEPRLRHAYDEIVKTQGYQATFKQQLTQSRDPAEQARIQASMQQNERYIAQQGEVIRGLKPQIDQFRDMRRQQVATILENNRKSFRDRELRNEFVYNELREKISREWAGANEELIPGVKNIDLISSDEHVMSLIRDGIKFRDRPSAKPAGASIAQLQNRKGSPTGGTKNEDESIRQLREQAKGGDKKAADNLLVAQLTKIRAARSRV